MTHYMSSFVLFALQLDPQVLKITSPNFKSMSNASFCYSISYLANVSQISQQKLIAFITFPCLEYSCISSDCQASSFAFNYADCVIINEEILKRRLNNLTTRNAFWKDGKISTWPRRLVDRIIASWHRFRQYGMQQPKIQHDVSICFNEQSQM